MKLSNLICETCKLRISKFYDFKRQCDSNTDILMQVKNELDKMHVTEEMLENEEACEQEEVLESENESFQLEKHKESSEKRKNKGKRTNVLKREKSYKGSQCSICGKIVKGIQMHMLIHSKVKKHSCNYCPKTFTQSGQLKRHVNSHLNIRNYECPVSGCERTFVDPSSVTKHLVVHNKDDRKFQCSLCGARFNRLGALRYHEKTHRQERNHLCHICNKSFLGMKNIFLLRYQLIMVFFSKI